MAVFSGNGTNAAPSFTFSSDTNTGIYRVGADSLGFATAGTLAMTIGSTQLVGINTSNPDTRLHVATGNATGYIKIDGGTSPSATLGLLLTTDSGAYTASFTQYQSNISISTGGTARQVITSGGNTLFGKTVTTGNGKIEVAGASSAWSYTGERLTSSSDFSSSIYSSNPATLNSTGGFTSKLKVGDKVIVDTSPQQIRYVTAVTSDTTATVNSAWTISFSAGTFVAIDKAVRLEGAPGVFVAAATAEGGGRFGIGAERPAYQLEVSTDSAAKPSTNTWTVSSDERLKEDIELADLDICYDVVKSIPLKRYKWRDDVYTVDEVADRRKLGWIAQDVEAVFPKAVSQIPFQYNKVYEELQIPAVEEKLDDNGNVMVAFQPARTEKRLISADIMEDCRNLNADQLYAAMFGAIQRLIGKVEALEAEIAALTS